MIIPDTMEVIRRNPERKQIILIGAETQVCIFQTYMDLKERNYDVFLPVDAITSIRKWERTIALQRLQQEGALLTSFEGIVFDMLRDAKD